MDPPGSSVRPGGPAPRPCARPTGPLRAGRRGSARRSPRTRRTSPRRRRRSARSIALSSFSSRSIIERSRSTSNSSEPLSAVCWSTFDSSPSPRSERSEASSCSIRWRSSGAEARRARSGSTGLRYFSRCRDCRVAAAGRSGGCRRGGSRRFLRRVDPHRRRERCSVASGGARRPSSRAHRLGAPTSGTSKVSSPVRPSVSTRLAGARTGAAGRPCRPGSTAVDALVALGDHGPDAEQRRPLRRPVARRAGAVLLAGEDDQRHALVAGSASAASKIDISSPSGRWRVDAALGARARAGCAAGRWRTCRAPSPRGCRGASRRS